MLEFNKHRKKSYIQLYGEAVAWRAIIKPEADQKKQSTYFNGKDANGDYVKCSVDTDLDSPNEESSDNPDLDSQNKEKIITLNIIAEKMGVKKSTLHKIVCIGDHAKKGNETAKFAMKMLNDGDLSTDSAYKLMKIDKIARSGTPAAMTAQTQIQRVKEKAITVAQAEHEVVLRVNRDIKREKQLVDLRDGEYNVILCDPPWHMETRPTYAVENHYDTLPLEKIINKEPPASDDCVLFLWTTVLAIRQAFEVLDAWGFTYKSHLIWDKGHKGIGSWLRGQHELLIIAIKGKVYTPEVENRYASVQNAEKEDSVQRPENEYSPSQIFEDMFNSDEDEESEFSSVYKEPHSGKHSEKPLHFYEVIEKMFPYGRYFEMYATKWRDGWDAMGNDLPHRETVLKEDHQKSSTDTKQEEVKKRRKKDKPAAQEKEPVVNPPHNAI